MLDTMDRNNHTEAIQTTATSKLNQVYSLYRKANL